MCIEVERDFEKWVLYFGGKSEMGDLELINRVRERGEMEEERFIIMVISRFLVSCSGIKRRGFGVMR